VHDAIDSIATSTGTSHAQDARGARAALFFENSNDPDGRALRRYPPPGATAFLPVGIGYTAYFQPKPQAESHSIVERQRRSSLLTRKMPVAIGASATRRPVHAQHQLGVFSIHQPAQYGKINPRKHGC
jgi:hypothetical protein